MNNQLTKQIASKIRVLYPFWIVIAIFSVAYVPSLIFVEDDILATATNHSENNMLFRLSIIGSFATAVLMVFIPFYLYLLFEKVNKNRAMLMLILALVAVPFMGFDVFKILSLSCQDAECIYTYLNTTKNIITVASVFWGLWLFPLGQLVIESKYFPKFLGYALMASCVGYLVGIIIRIVFPSANYLLVVTEVLTFGEVIFALWFIVRGVRLES